MSSGLADLQSYLAGQDELGDHDDSRATAIDGACALPESLIISANMPSDVTLENMAGADNTADLLDYEPDEVGLAAAVGGDSSAFLSESLVGVSQEGKEKRSTIRQAG